MATRLVDLVDFEKQLRSNPGSDNYAYSFGGSINSILKGFTTNPDKIFIPHFQGSLYATDAGASSSGLNPFGPNTLGEGILWGNERQTDLDTNIDPADVRTYGIKAPIVTVGWGFDIWGLPAPNRDRDWDVSGIFSSTGSPSNYWKGKNFSYAEHGKDVPYQMWKSGPVDLRWDQQRGVWTSNNSVYAARVVKSYINNTPVDNEDPESAFANTLKYDVAFYDGVANQFTLTGIRNVGPRPYNELYKVYPFVSGDAILIVHADVSGRPGFGVFTCEAPATLDCSGVDGGGDTGEGGIEGDIVYNFTTVPSGSLLLGSLNNSGSIDLFKFVQGTGINIDVVNGTGLRVSATNLSGITDPLPISLGGTSSSTKSFVDLTSSQSVSGIKSFTSQLQVGSGYSVTPSLSVGLPSYGLYLTNGASGVGISASGLGCQEIGYEYNYLNTPVIINPQYFASGAYDDYSRASLTVLPFDDYAADYHLQIWKDLTDVVGHMSYRGNLYCQSISVSGISVTGTNIISMSAASGFFEDTINCKDYLGNVYYSVNTDGSRVSMGASGARTTIVSTSGNIDINFASGITANIVVTGSITLNVLNGLIVGYS